MGRWKCYRATVPFLGVKNEGAKPILIPEGEILIGAKQNRVVNLTVLVAANSTFRLPEDACGFIAAYGGKVAGLTYWTMGAPVHPAERYPSTSSRIVSGRTPSCFIASNAWSVLSASCQVSRSGVSTINPIRFEPCGSANSSDRDLERDAIGESFSPVIWERPSAHSGLNDAGASLTRSRR